MIVVVAINASTAVNVFITIMIHHVDCSFGFRNQEKELLKYFIILSFFRVIVIWMTKVTNLMTNVLLNAVSDHWKSFSVVSDDD
jgi:hypothetical protein